MRSGPIAQNLAFTPWAMEIDPDPVWISAISAAWQQDPDIYLYGPLPKSDNSDTEKGGGRPGSLQHCLSDNGSQIHGNFPIFKHGI